MLQATLDAYEIFSRGCGSARQLRVSEFLVNNFFAVMGVLAEFASESKPQYYSQARLVE